jgi:hypothetical protein
MTSPPTWLGRPSSTSIISAAPVTGLDMLAIQNMVPRGADVKVILTPA